MDHQLIIAQNLRKGLEQIKILYRQALANNPLWEQWAYLGLYEQGMTWERHDQIERTFANDSRKLLGRIRGK